MLLAKFNSILIFQHWLARVCAAPIKQFISDVNVLKIVIRETTTSRTIHIYNHKSIYLCN